MEGNKLALFKYFKKMCLDALDCLDAPIFMKEAFKKGIHQCITELQQTDFANMLPNAIAIRFSLLFKKHLIYSLPQEHQDEGLAYLMQIERVILSNHATSSMQPDEKVKDLKRIKAQLKEIEFILNVKREAREYIDGVANYLDSHITHNSELIPSETKQDSSSKQPNPDNGKNTINQIWRHGAANLKEVSKMLYNNGYTDSIDSFERIFIVENNARCNWVKRKTALLYLFGNLTNTNDAIPGVVLDFICDKITFKGKITTRHILKTQLSKISDVFSCPQRN